MTRTHKTPKGFWRVLGIALAIVAIGCDGGGSGGDDTDTDGDVADESDGVTGECQRDPELLATRLDCIRDDHCPCGAHCVLGLCEHDCMDDADCGEAMVCDRFGRCRDESDPGPFGPVDISAESVLETSTTAMEFRTPSTERVVRVWVEERAAGTVRIEADEGVQVQCDPDAGWLTECFWDSLEVGPEASRTLRVRYVGAPASDEDIYSRVRIFTGNLRRTLSIRVVSPNLTMLSLDDGTGVYEGKARLQGAWLTSNPRPDDSFPDGFPDVEVPVIVKVYPMSGGQHVVTLEDDLGILFPQSPTVGRMTDSGGTWQLDVGTHLYIDGEPGATDTPEVTVAYSSASTEWTRGALDVVMDAVYEGVTTDEFAPVTRWQLSLAWDRDLEAGDTAPTVPDPFVGRDVVSVATTTLTVEDSARPDFPASLGTEPYEQAQAALCTCCDSTAALETMSEDILLLPSSLPSPTGDLSCGDPGDPQLGLPFLSQNSFLANEVVQECLDDLSVMDDGGSGIGSTGCVDASRIVLAMSLALQIDRQRATDPGSAPMADERASAIGHRLLQQWAAVHVFVVGEADSVTTLNDILPEGMRLSQAYTSLEALDRGARGWDLLLHPRIGVALPLIPDDVLYEPDYRPRLFSSGSYPDIQSNEQTVGIPASVLGSLATQMGHLVHQVDLSWSGSMDFSEVEPLATGYLRRSVVLLGISRGLYYSARTVGDPVWHGEWDDAQIAWGSAVTGLFNAVNDYESGRNMLGIEDEDLPIYRVGDEVSANARFSALSDYLLGTGPEDTAVAPALVNRADDSLSDAQTLWSSFNERNLQMALLGDDRGRRVEGINRKYGEEIISLCGNPDWSSDTVLAMWNEIDPNTCFVMDDCRPTVEDRQSRINAAELGYMLCFVGKVRERYTDASVGSTLIEAEADALASRLYREDTAFPLVIAGTSDTEVFFDVTDVTPSTRRSLTWEEFEAYHPIENVDMDLTFVEEVRTVCESAKQATLSERPVLAPDSCTFADECPLDYGCQAGECKSDTGTDALDRPECFQGSMGATAIGLQTAAKEVEIAESEVVDLIDQYALAMDNCNYMHDRHEDIESAIDDFNEEMDRYAKVKLAFQIATNFAAATKDIGGDALPKPWGIGAAYAEASFQSVVDGMDFAMEQAERELDEEITGLEHQIEWNACKTEAKMIHTEIDTARLRAQAALLYMAQATVEFQAMKGELRALCRDGHSAIVNETFRKVDPLSLDYWVDEAVEDYRKHMRQARRAAYLAVLAVEYEFQFSSMEREAVLSANTPSDLSSALDNLRAFAMTGTVGGALPADLFAVVSMSNHLAEIADLSALPPGLTPEERFHAWLTSPDNAVYDEHGNYLGQEISFSLWPREDSGGIPLLAGTDCAERLWSVNASLLGADVVLGSSTFSRVVLRKRNTFHSQWCTGTHDAEYQDASTRPAVNLFLDPYDFNGSDTPYTPEPDTTSVDQIRAFSNARISAYFGVTQAELEDETYFNGDSQELAGRGLYGDYALFFPAATLSTEGSDGLLLEHVDDVLLRFDYVSVSAGI